MILTAVALASCCGPKDGEYTFPVQEIPAPEGTYAEAAAEAERIRKEHRRKSAEREVNQ